MIQVSQSKKPTESWNRNPQPPALIGPPGTAESCTRGVRGEEIVGHGDGCSPRAELGPASARFDQEPRTGAQQWALNLKYFGFFLLARRWVKTPYLYAGFESTGGVQCVQQARRFFRFFFNNFLSALTLKFRIVTLISEKWLLFLFRPSSKHYLFLCLKYILSPLSIFVFL